MTDKDKVELMDYIIRYLESKVTSEDMPVMVGTLSLPQGVKGFKTAEVGHPVFEFKDRYMLYLESNDGKTTVSIPYYKDSLKPVIKFNIL